MGARAEGDLGLEDAARVFQHRTGNRVPARAQERFAAALARLETPGELLRDLRDAGGALLAPIYEDALSIPESYFFRDPSGWNAVVEHALPEFAAAGRGARVWSAGCARGEEPETLLLLAQAHGLGASRLRVLATDAAEGVLADARRATYGQWSLRALPPELERFFEEGADGWRLLRDKLPGAVEYRRHNLLVDELPAPWGAADALDLLLCRNLLIYFHEEGVTRAFELFRHLVRPGGYLLLSSTDPWPGGEHWERVVPSAALFRRRVEDGASEGAAAPAFDEPLEEWRPPAAPPPDPLLLARFQLERGHPAEALAALEQGLVEDGCRSDLHYLRGELLLGGGDLAAAEEALRRALYLEGEHPAAALALHRCLRRRGDLEGGVRYLRMARRVAAALAPEQLAGAGADVNVAEFRALLGKEQGPGPGKKERD